MKNPFLFPGGDEKFSWIAENIIFDLFEYNLENFAFFDRFNINYWGILFPKQFTTISYDNLRHSLTFVTIMT